MSSNYGKYDRRHVYLYDDEWMRLQEMAKSMGLMHPLFEGIPNVSELLRQLSSGKYQLVEVVDTTSEVVEK